MMSSLNFCSPKIEMKYFWLIFKVNAGSRVQTIWSNRCLIIRLVDHWKFQKPATAAQEIKSILTGNEYWFECQRQPIFLRRQTHCDKKCFSPKKSKYRFWRYKQLHCIKLENWPCWTKTFALSQCDERQCPLYFSEWSFISKDFSVIIFHW